MSNIEEAHYIEFKDFVSKEKVENFLTRQGYTIKNVKISFKVQFAESNGMGLEPTGEWTWEERTFRVALLDPDIEITDRNYGNYLVGVIFEEIIFQKLINFLTQ